MDIAEDFQGNILILTPKGRIDSVSSGELEIKVLNYIDKNHHNMILDCKEVDFVSSAGLRVFLMAAKKLKPINGKLVLCNISPEVREVFDVSGFTSLFSIQHHLKDAIAQF